jgi:hypothetical protein
MPLVMTILLEEISVSREEIAFPSRMNCHEHMGS